MLVLVLVRGYESRAHARYRGTRGPFVVHLWSLQAVCGGRVWQ